MGKIPPFAICALALARAAFAAPVVAEAAVDSIVHPVTVEILSRAIEQAQKNGASLLLIRLNTPGGLMEAMRESVEKIVASPVPVVTYVAPSGGRAASAGFFLLQAGDVAAMAPGTNTGAAHPVAIGVQMDAVMKQKVENDAAASLRSLTAKRGRNAALAETAVRESKSFTEKEALESKLIELIARDRDDLLRQLDGRQVTRFDGSTVTLRTAGAAVIETELSTRQRVLRAISDPNVALVILILGLLGIYVEFSAPGLIFPGALGGILVLLGLSALSVLPISGAGVALLILAVLLFVLEAKVASHGLLGVGGAAAMVLGAVLLVDSPLPEMRIRYSVAIALALPFAAITVFLVTIALRARRNKVVTGSEGMTGETGSALTALDPEGMVMVRGEYWKARAASSVPAGARIRVTAMDKLQLTVEAIPEGD